MGTRPSYERVNYLLRPRKQIERKIIIEIFQRLSSVLSDFDKYDYIGMGSIYYFDFILFHKFLDFKNLYSIDNKITSNRFEFNKPYDFVKFINKKSTDFLTEDIKWNNNKVIWLDYDFSLNDDVLEDISIISNRCNINDVFVFTIEAKCIGEERFDNTTDNGTLDQINKINLEIKKKFIDTYKKYIPISERKLINCTPKKFSSLLQDICMNAIIDKTERRDVKFRKLFCYEYADGKNMLTLGGIFLKKDSPDISIDHKFLCSEKDIIKIDIPLLTYKEKTHLDSILEFLQANISGLETKISENDIQTEDLEKIFIHSQLKDLDFELSLNDLKSYLNYYKYYPQYYEGII